MDLCLSVFTPVCSSMVCVAIPLSPLPFLIPSDTDYLAESDFVEDLDHIVRCFDKTTKVRFSNDKQPQYIKFGSTRDNDATRNIRFGQLKLDGQDVARFFDGSVKCIVNATKEQMRLAHKPISVSLVHR